jgi:hypothetical protein
MYTFSRNLSQDSLKFITFSGFLVWTRLEVRLYARLWPGDGFYLSYYLLVYLRNVKNL